MDIILLIWSTLADKHKIRKDKKHISINIATAHFLSPPTQV